MHRTLFVICVGVLGSLTSAKTTHAQCEPEWQPLDPNAGMNFGVLDLTTLPSGELVAGGQFTTAGGVGANYIARWNPASQQWSALGTGTNNFVGALTTLPGGDLVAGGWFTTAGGVIANRIARWNPASQQWSALGTGTSNVVFALTTLLSGELVAGGSFNSAGGVTVNRIARWNPASQQWSALGTGMNGQVSTLTTLPVGAGDLIAGGLFTTAGGVPANYIARWNLATQQWSALGTGMDGWVFALTTLPGGGGDLIAAGGFTTAGGVSANRIARWNPASQQWSALGAGLNGNVEALTTLPGGDLIAGGQFTTAGGVNAKYIARWNPASQQWSFLWTGVNSFVHALTTLPGGGGDVIAGGEFTTAGGVVAPFVARWACPPAPACYPDCDLSGGLDIDDFICFQTLFAIGDPSADCDASGGLDIDDFICFQTLYAIGC